MEESRPDPDALLAEIGGEEERQGRGRLKVFLGATAGVGKTYAMLEAGRERRAAGRDVVVGIVETHGRRETAALLQGMDVLPRRSLEHQGVALDELDLDGTLARRPDLVLVDELAHTNAPGSRHEKRWQDVEELLAEGIDVFTTVNIQHLESLNDVVARITQIRVHETVPDRLVETADEVELIDLPPDELLRRLSEGKVYVPEQAERARQRFFRRGNLIALRQLALRYTAGHVDEDMRGYRRAHGVRATWPVAERLLVGVGPAPSSRNLVRATKRIADQLGAEWHAVFVETPEYAHWPEADRQRVWETLRLARELGAETSSLGGAGAAALLDYARRENVTKVVVGKPHHASWRDRVFGSRLEEVIRGSGDVDVYVISGDEPGDAESRKPRAPVGREAGVTDVVWALVGVATATAIAVFLRGDVELANVVMLYLAVIVFVAARLGRRASLVASVVSVAAFDFFIVPPYNTFAIGDTRYLPVFVVMLVVSMVVSTLTVRLRAQAEASRHREWRTAALLDLSRELVPLEEPAAIAGSVARQLSALFECPVRVLAPDPFGKLRNLDPTTAGEEATVGGVAEWVLDQGKPAGRGTNTLPEAAALYVPITTGERVLGVLEVGGTTAERFRDPEQMQLLETFARQTAAALDRARLAVESRRGEQLAEVGRLKSRFVSVAAHDLRTPLERLGEALGKLRELGAPGAADPSGAVLLDTAVGDVERLRGTLGELLDLSRLESGALELHQQEAPPAEVAAPVIATALPRARARGASSCSPRCRRCGPCTRTSPRCAACWTTWWTTRCASRGPASCSRPTNSPTSCSSRSRTTAPASPSTTRRRSSSPSPGTAADGTGDISLALTRAIVRAHGGDIWVDSGPGPGSVFSFTMPRADAFPPEIHA